jgi:hypothetical protein
MKHMRRVKKEREDLRWTKVFNSPVLEYKYLKDTLVKETCIKKTFYMKELAY